MAKLNLLAIDKVELRKRFTRYVIQFQKISKGLIRSGPLKAYDTGDYHDSIDYDKVKYEQGSLVSRIFSNVNLLGNVRRGKINKLYPIFVQEGHAEFTIIKTRATIPAMEARPHFDKAWELIQNLDINLDNILYVK